MPLPKYVRSHRRMRDVEVFYADRSLTVHWNKERPPEVPQYFCGHYWINGTRHNGPFKSYSAAMRDAYFVNALRRPPEVPNQQRSKK